jgi:hypothetical protein
MYCGGTIYIDITSGTVHVYNQVFLAAADTLLSKAQFEHEACTHGIDIKKYHTDNGIFVSAAWKEHLHGMKQKQRVSATGATHKRSSNATASHWPDKYDMQLWPAWLYNYTPKSNNLAPIKIITRQLNNCEFLQCNKVFGCPIYVLEPHLQDGKKIPKWEPRPRCHSVSSIQYQSCTPGYTTASLSQTHKINRAQTKTKDCRSHFKNALTGTTVDSYNLLVAGNLSRTLCVCV